MRNSLRWIGIVLLFVGLGMSTAADVSAQVRNGERRGLIDITVWLENDVCKYEVSSPGVGIIPVWEGVPFRIWAHGFLRLLAKETPAQVQIRDDIGKQARGYAHRGAAKLFPGHTETIRVRARRDEDPVTVHMVDFTCCKGGITDDGVCIDPKPALRPTKSSFGKSSLGRDASDVNLATGAMTTDELVRLLAGQQSEPDTSFPVAGPDMEIDP